MKKLALVSSMLVLGTQAFAADDAAPAVTVYGKVNKEVHYIKQDVAARKSHGVVDVQNSETRVGVKGGVAVMGDMKANFTLEMGIDSNNTNTGANAMSGSATDSRIRIRHAKIDLNDFWGTLTLGQTQTLMGEFGQAADPLNYTSLGQNGADQKNYVGTGGSFGYNERGRADLMMYRSPVVAGFQFATAFDQANASPALTGSAAYYNNESNVSYTFKSDDMTLVADLGLSKALKSLDKSDFTYGGLKATFGSFVAAGRYTMQKAVAANGVETKPNYMLGALTYNMGMHAFSFTYGNHKYDNATETKDTQLAFGYAVKPVKALTLTAMVGMPKYATTATENKAKWFALGTQLAF